MSGPHHLHGNSTECRTTRWKDTGLKVTWHRRHPVISLCLPCRLIPSRPPCSQLLHNTEASVLWHKHSVYHCVLFLDTLAVKYLSLLAQLNKVIRIGHHKTPMLSAFQWDLLSEELWQVTGGGKEEGGGFLMARLPQVCCPCQQKFTAPAEELTLRLHLRSTCPLSQNACLWVYRWRQSLG